MTPNGNESGYDESGAAGAAWEAAGLTSRHDYARLQMLTDTIQASRPLADADLEWLVALLESTGEAIVRSKVMVMLAATGDLGSLPQQYRERIMSVVTPLLRSENRLDKLSAAHLHQALIAGLH
jgi:hypothetical protein